MDCNQQGNNAQVGKSIYTDIRIIDVAFPSTLYLFYPEGDHMHTTKILADKIFLNLD